MEQIDVAPGLLISMPHLDSEHFVRSVILMIEHGDDGSFGLVLNQPSDILVSELFEHMEIAWPGNDDALVGSGGPVMPSSGWVLHSRCQKITSGAPGVEKRLQALDHGGTVWICDGLELSASATNFSILADSPPQHARFFLGYAGWGPNQLAGEMALGSWLHCQVDIPLIFEAKAEDMWTQALGLLGIRPESLISSHGVH